MEKAREMVKALVKLLETEWVKLQETARASESLQETVMVSVKIPELER